MKNELFERLILPVVILLGSALGAAFAVALALYHSSGGSTTPTS